MLRPLNHMANNSLDPKIDNVQKQLREVNERLGRIEHSVSLLGISQKINPDSGASQVPNQIQGRWPQLQKSVIWVQRELGVPFLRFLWVPLSIVITLTGFVATYVSLRYDVAVAPYTSFSPTEPLQTRFLLTNEGPFSIYDVTYSCLTLHSHGGAGPVLGKLVPDSLPELRAHAAYSIYCGSSHLLDHLQAGTLLDIQIYYRAKFVFWKRKTGDQAFGLLFDKQGNAVWLSVGGGGGNLKELNSITVKP
jgi:hypothetical protein